MTASVVVCVYNRPVDVRRCVASLLTQTLDDLEIVLVDDASTDETPAVLEQLIREHPDQNIKVVRNEQNLGVSGARNSGIAVASTDHVLFLDSDCVAEPGWAEGLCRGLARGASAASGTVLEPPPTTWADRAYFGGLRVGIPGQRRPLAGCNMGFLSAVVIAEPFDAVLRYTADEDDIARRLKALGHSFAFCPEATVVHHHHMTTRGYLSTAWRQGAGSAHLWYKHNLGIGRDLIFLLLAVLSLPLLLVPWVAVVPAIFLSLQVLALFYSEMRFKGKPAGAALIALPLTFAYSVVKLASVLWRYVLILMGLDPDAREAKRQWHARLTPP